MLAPESPTSYPPHHKESFFFSRIKSSWFVMSYQAESLSERVIYHWKVKAKWKYISWALLVAACATNTSVSTHLDGKVLLTKTYMVKSPLLPWISSCQDIIPWFILSIYCITVFLHICYLASFYILYYHAHVFYQLLILYYYLCFIVIVFVSIYNSYIEERCV